MLLCLAIRMIVKASTPDSPSLESIVWRRDWSTKSSGNIPAKRFLPRPSLRRGRRSAGRGQQIAEIAALLLAGGLGCGGQLA